MSRELAERFGFKIGERVLYPNYQPYVVYMDVVTIKDVRMKYEESYNLDYDYDNEIVVDVEEHEGYILPSQLYTKDMINKMLEEKEEKIEDFPSFQDSTGDGV